jgi:hypothetical protein
MSLHPTPRQCRYTAVPADLGLFVLQHEQVEVVLAQHGYNYLRYEINAEGKGHWICFDRNGKPFLVDIVMRDIVQGAMLKLLLSP